MMAVVIVPLPGSKTISPNAKATRSRTPFFLAQGRDVLSNEYELQRNIPRH